MTIRVPSAGDNNDGQHDFGLGLEYGLEPREYQGLIFRGLFFTRVNLFLLQGIFGFEPPKGAGVTGGG